MKKLMAIMAVLLVLVAAPRMASAFTLIEPLFACVIDASLIGAVTPYNDTSMKGYSSDAETGVTTVWFDDLANGSADAVLPDCMEGALNSAIQINNELKKNAQSLNLKVVEYGGVPTVLGISGGKDIPQF